MKIKRLFSVLGLGLFAMAAAGAGVLAFNSSKGESVSAANRTLYCRCAQDWWKSDGAAVGAYYWGGTDGSAWPGVRMTAVAGETDLWSIDIPDDHTGVIFTRVNGSGEIADWGAKTADLAIPTDGKNCYTINSDSPVWGDPGVAGEWGTYTPSAVTHTISFCEVVNGVLNPTPFDTETVGDGYVFNVPGNRFKSGYSFDGWYTDSTCETLYTNKAITADLTIYARYTSGTWSGTYKVELAASGCSWSEAAANYAIYFFNPSFSPTVEGWSEYATGTAQSAPFVEISYNLDFAPTNFLVVRYSPEFGAEAWAANKWASETDYKWGQTEDLFFNSDKLVRVGAYNLEIEKNNASTGDPKVIGGTEDNWNDIDYLFHSKVNGAGHPEFYYDSVYLESGTNFKVQHAPYGDGDYVATYTAHDGIKDYFSVNPKNGNIVCSQTGNYAVYYDDSTLSFYITTPALAEADEWAQEFLTVNCTATKAQWSVMSARFIAMSPTARGLFTSEEHVSYKEEVEGYIAKAVQRYDYILELYGTEGEGSFEDFMGRAALKLVEPGSLKALSYELVVSDSKPTIIFACIALVSVSSLLLVNIVRRRAHN